MIIGVDGNDANIDMRVGVSVYTYELLQYFQKTASKKISFLIFLKNKPMFDMPSEHIYFKYVYIYGPKFWLSFSLPLYFLFHKTIDVFFSPTHYTPLYCPCPIVVTIHDLSYFYFPNDFLKKDLYKLTTWTKSSIHKSSSIIAVSNSTKQDIIKHYNLNQNKISVIHNGFRDFSKTKLSSSKLTNAIYFLYVGTLQPRKNIETLIRAFSLFYVKHKIGYLYIVGKKGWLYKDIFNLVTKLNLTNQVKFKGYVSKKLLISYYKNAKAFILPSLYEGFGFPILEAMSLSCPVITTNISSLPEIGGNAPLYFSPNDTISLFKHMEKLFFDTKIRNACIQKGLEQIKHFSWNHCAELTLDLLIKNTKHA